MRKLLFLLAIVLLPLGVKAQYAYTRVTEGDTLLTVPDSLWIFGDLVSSSVGTSTTIMWKPSAILAIVSDTTDDHASRLDALEGAESTFDSLYLYTVKLQQMSDSTATNADSINIAMDSLRVHIARILALEGSGVSGDIADLTGTAWRVFYSDGSGDVTELALGADGTYLKSNGADQIPSFDTPAGAGDMLAADSSVVYTSWNTFLDSITNHPSYAEMNAVISDSLDALIAEGETGVALADSSGVAAGSYVTGWDFVAGQALKVDLADSSGVAAGSYVTGYDYATGIALKANSSDVALNTDVDLFFAYGGGFSLPGDTALWIMDADKEIGYRKQIEDTLIITLIEWDLSAGDTLNYSYVYGDTLEDADVTILAVTAGGGRVAYTSFTNAKVPEGNYVWIDIGEQIAGKKPIYFRSEIYGYIKRD